MSEDKGAPAAPVRLEFVEMSDAAAPVTPRDGLVGRLEQAALSADSGYAIDAELLTEAAKCIADLEPDAERYAWIKSRQHADIAAAWLLPLAIPCASVDDLDNAIDCARSIDAAPVTPAFADPESTLVAWMESVIKELGGSIFWDEERKCITAQVRYDFTDIGHGQTLAEVRADALAVEEGEPKGDTQ